MCLHFTVCKTLISSFYLFMYLKTFHFILEYKNQQCCDSSRRTAKGCGHTSTGIHSPLPARLPRNIEQSALCYTLCPCRSCIHLHLRAGTQSSSTMLTCCWYASRCTYRVIPHSQNAFKLCA